MQHEVNSLKAGGTREREGRGGAGVGGGQRPAGPPLPPLWGTYSISGAWVHFKQKPKDYRHGSRFLPRPLHLKRLDTRLRACERGNYTWQSAWHVRNVYKVLIKHDVNSWDPLIPFSRSTSACIIPKYMESREKNSLNYIQLNPFFYLFDLKMK